jgi:hypothetical protein
MSTTEGATRNAPHVPRAGVGSPTTEHQALWNQIDARIMDTLTRYLPKMGTVLGNVGGQVQVTLDDEADDRQVAIPRVKGVRHVPGDRVKVQPLMGGDHVIDSIISTRAGRDPAVDSDDIYAGGVKTVNLAGRAVTAAELGLGSVSRSHLATDANQAIDAAYNQGTAGITAAGIAQGTANTAFTNAGTANTAIGTNNGQVNGSTGLWNAVYRALRDAADAQTSADSAGNGLAAVRDNDLVVLKARVAKLETWAATKGFVK